MDSGFKNMSQIAFNKEIEARFPSIQRGRDRVSKRRIWKGLRFVPDGLEIDACINGRFVAFEVKTETGKLTKLQEITLQKIRDANGQAFKVTSAAEVAAILKELEVCA